MKENKQQEIDSIIRRYYSSLSSLFLWVMLYFMFLEVWMKQYNSHNFLIMAKLQLETSYKSFIIFNIPQYIKKYLCFYMELKLLSKFEFQNFRQIFAFTENDIICCTLLIDNVLFVTIIIYQLIVIFQVYNYLFVG